MDDLERYFDEILRDSDDPEDRFVTGDSSITSLDLHDKRIGLNRVTSIADALRHNTTLTFLDLGHNSFGPEGAKVVADALRYNKTLTSLRIDENYIGDDGAASFAGMLRHNKTLTNLRIGSNRIHNNSILQDAISENGTLLEVEGVPGVEQYLERNRAYRRCREAIWAFLLGNKHMYRDVRIMIARAIWATRDDPKWKIVGDDETISKRLKLIKGCIMCDAPKAAFVEKGCPYLIYCSRECQYDFYN